MRPRRALALLLVAGAASTAAGCGSDADTENAYVTQVTSAQADYTREFGRIAKGLTPTSTLVQDRATLGAFGRTTRRFVGELRRIAPPARVRDEHDGLVAAVLGYQQQVERARNRLRDGSNEARAEVRTDLSSSVEETRDRISAAVRAINQDLSG